MTNSVNEIRSNVPEFTVTELAFSLRQTLEENYGRVRVRGELSRISIPGSGHMYSTLKDADAVIDAVCWKGNLAKLSVRPEEGLEVICIGRVSSYPKSSKYQLIIESMELAGEGALLKMLEERRKKLAAEGLFDTARKKPLPFLPEVIGVVTSPTGAVIRDILHRLKDRFPRHVIVWPVLVQGEGAAQQIAAAIRGFENIQPKPDVLIVARGGGSLEDLMAFNEEIVVRAAADCSIPLISAVGHETDTTLIDYAADLRAPTPTGAAEMAVPVRSNLLAQIAEDEGRLVNSMTRLLSEYRHRLEAQAKGLGDPARMLENKVQNLDRLSDRINAAFRHFITDRQSTARELGARLRHPKDRIAEAERILANWSERMEQTGWKLLEKRQSQLKSLSAMLDVLSFESVLERGFAVVYGPGGELITEAAQAQSGDKIRIQFRQKKHVDAVVSASTNASAKKPATKKEDPGQNSLF
ncbi:MAG TPA: exodeoxyribonuclease VII large subunit [Rhodospirillaceae bacterium]|nr:exodeoxyribonuclease VII large subunit [Rhodospirillaceae bacterium]